jgi:hypothetical protein
MLSLERLRVLMAEDGLSDSDLAELQVLLNLLAEIVCSGPLVPRSADPAAQPPLYETKSSS